MPNSPADPLPALFYGSNSAAGAFGHTVAKILIYNLFLM